MKKFIEMLEDKSSSVATTSIAIQGFGQFAAPISKLMGAKGLKDILERLFQHSERFSRYCNHAVSN